MNIENDFTRAIRAKAQELGLNQAQLAKRIGVVQSAMVLVLRGMSQPNSKTIRKYAKFLGLSVAAVKTMTGGKQTPKTRLAAGQGHSPMEVVHELRVKDVLALAGDDLAWVVHRAPKEVRGLLRTALRV